jgi:hypothetical protein
MIGLGTLSAKKPKPPAPCSETGCRARASDSARAPPRPARRRRRARVRQSDLNMILWCRTGIWNEHQIETRNEFVLKFPWFPQAGPAGSSPPHICIIVIYVAPRAAAPHAPMHPIAGGARDEPCCAYGSTCQRHIFASTSLGPTAGSSRRGTRAVTVVESTRFESAAVRQDFILAITCVTGSLQAVRDTSQVIREGIVQLSACVFYHSGSRSTTTREVSACCCSILSHKL